MSENSSSDGNSSFNGLTSILVKPVIGFLRYFFPKFECSITIGTNFNHTFYIKNTDKRKLHIISIKPIKGFIKGKHSVNVDKKTGIKGRFNTSLHYPYEEMEWCWVVIKRFIPIPQIKEVKENKKVWII